MNKLSTASFISPWQTGIEGRGVCVARRNESREGGCIDGPGEAGVGRWGGTVLGWDGREERVGACDPGRAGATVAGHVGCWEEPFHLTRDLRVDMWTGGPVGMWTRPCHRDHELHCALHFISECLLSPTGPSGARHDRRRRDGNKEGEDRTKESHGRAGEASEESEPPPDLAGERGQDAADAERPLPPGNCRCRALSRLLHTPPNLFGVSIGQERGRQQMLAVSILAAATQRFVLGVRAARLGTPRQGCTCKATGIMVKIHSTVDSPVALPRREDHRCSRPRERARHGRAFSVQRVANRCAIVCRRSNGRRVNSAAGCRQAEVGGGAAGSMHSKRAGRRAQADGKKLAGSTERSALTGW